MEKLVLENLYYKIVVPLFGAEYAAPTEGTTILINRSMPTVLRPTENSRIQRLFKAFECFSRTF